ncbi:MAG TPA: HoxN/HupN/NixA family nickel/cobalt transporter [Rhodopila sp.]|jgi:high-affinity nickel-transport protein|nr:HoxN/HupN/NixA family nickel/cobalt transporter [Rhodopila sp.]
MRRLLVSPAGLPLVALAGVNLLAWSWAAIAFHHRPDLLGSALLAWLFGLRHAVDADHLAAIDNVVRKLMQEGQRPRLVGLHFSLGHSTVVILAATVIAATASSAALSGFAATGGTIGTLISSGFLLLIALVNLHTLIRLLQGRADHPPHGLLARLLRPAMRLIRRPSQMYPLGFLFGLGFDTATEVGLLALAATQAASGLSFVDVLIFPVLFTAGMALVDTADSVLMVGAYGWAFVDPARKRTYNITVTVLSVIVALGIGGLETLGLLVDRLPSIGPELPDRILDHMGYVIVAAFIATWAVFAWRYQRRRPLSVGNAASRSSS